MYSKHKELKIFGIYLSYRPVLILTDPKLVQDILIRDFQSFHDRPMPVNEEKDPLSGHLFNIGIKECNSNWKNNKKFTRTLAGQKWRDLRVKLSPTFTSGKLKGMFPIIKNCGQTLSDYLAKSVENNVDVIEFRDLMARFNTNIISSVAFGIDNDCINEPDHLFRKMGAKFFEPSLKNGVRGMMMFLGGSKWLHKVGMKSVDDDVEEFMFSIVKQNVEYREDKSFSRNDFMQLLIQLKNQGFISVDKDDKDSEQVKNPAEKLSKINMNELTAQAFVWVIMSHLFV